MRRRWIRVASGIAIVIAIAACKQKAADVARDPDKDVASIVVRDTSEGLLLTWIDDKGDFHVEDRVANVPLTGRDTVRVVDGTKDDATDGDNVAVVDLRTARPDGTYAVHAMARAAFDQLALARRQKNGSATLVAPPANTNAAPPPNVTMNGGNGASPSDPSATTRPHVIIYGASWCSACHDAAAYLRKKGVPFVEKDVDADENAQREMSAKLAKAGQRGGSIPVIDVGGKIMVGFSARALDEAIGKAI